MSTKNDAIVATFPNHSEAETAVRKLADGGMNMKQFSIIGKGYHTEEKVIGFYNAGDRITFWGENGAIWGGLWGLFFGGMMLTIPVIGPVVVLGHLAAMVFAAVEGAVVVGGISALGAALFSIGLPENSIIEYEEALKTDGFLIIANGSADDMARAKTILVLSNATRIDLHQDLEDVTAPSDAHSGHHAAA